MTILIVGGAAQGKSAFARRISPETEIVDNLQDIVREAMQEGKSIPKAEAFLGKTVVCNELGCGVVPVDAFDREYRERTGRVCTVLAAASDEVYRVICGVGLRIK